MPDIESLLKEKRIFKPDAAFTRAANWNKREVSKLRKEGADNPQRFWAKMAKEHVSWFTPWKKTVQWKPPFAKWFVGGKLNVSYNCIDRHLEGENAWRRNKAAIIWEGEPGDQRVLTYGQLHREVCKFANVLKGLGVSKGDLRGPEDVRRMADGPLVFALANPTPEIMPDLAREAGAAVGLEVRPSLAPWGRSVQHVRPVFSEKARGNVVAQ